MSKLCAGCRKTYGIVTEEQTNKFRLFCTNNVADPEAVKERLTGGEEIKLDYSCPDWEPAMHFAGYKGNLHSIFSYK